MKITSLRFLILSIPILLLSTNIFSQTKVYDGAINGKYNIEMHLNFVKNSIYGYYFYKSKKLPIALFGEIKGTKIILIESDLADTSVFFQGDIAGSQIVGQWQDKYKKSKMQFLVTQSDIVDSSKHISIKNGNYENNSSDIIQFCSIYYIDNNLLFYECSVGTENCDGEIFGIAKIDRNGKAQSLKLSDSTDSCYLKFEFAKNKIRILEGGDCTSSHGANCTFSGVFIN